MIPYPSIRSLLDSQVKRFGDRTFAIFHDDGDRISLSFSEFSNRVGQCANYLRRKKVEFGDAVPVESKDARQCLTQVFGVWAVGGKVDLTGRSSRIFPSEPTEFADLLQQDNTATPVGKKTKLSADSLLIRGRRGRTVVLSHYNLLVNGMAIAERFSFSESDTLLCTEPVQVPLTLCGGLMTALYAGCRLLLAEKGALEKLASIETDETIRAAFTSSPLIDPKRRDMGQMLVPHASQRNVDSRVNIGFFMPELTGFASFSQGDDDAHDGLIPVGTPLHPCEMAILNQDGRELPEGTLGQIAVRGHNVMKGYLYDEGAEETSFAHGWFNTGWSGLFKTDTSGAKSFFTVAKEE